MKTLCKLFIVSLLVIGGSNSGGFYANAKSGGGERVHKVCNGEGVRTAKSGGGVEKG